MTFGACEKLRALPSMGADIEDDSSRLHQPGNRRGKRLVMLPGCRL
jgi:hypothetical protein